MKLIDQAMRLTKREPKVGEVKGEESRQKEGRRENGLRIEKGVHISIEPTREIRENKFKIGLVELMNNMGRVGESVKTEEAVGVVDPS